MNKTVDIPATVPTNHPFEHCVYLITGATGGLGKALSLQLAQHGATVILTGQNNEKLDKLYDEIVQARGPCPIIIPFNLEQKDDEEYEKLLHSIYNKFKRLDGIVHLACYSGVIGPLASQDSASWQKTQQINVNAAMTLSKACLPLLQQAPRPSITFVSDSSARQSKAYWGAYGVSKIALESLSSILADEFEGTSIVSNVFIPGASVLPIRKKTHPGEENTGLCSAKQVAKRLLRVIASRQSGQCFAFQP